jgi:hypothetical protein
MLAGGSSPVESFQVVVRITGNDRNVYEAVTSKFRNNEFDHLGTANLDDLRDDQYTSDVKGTCTIGTLGLTRLLSSQHRVVIMGDKRYCLKCT